jgi:hypothetical protein
MNYREIRKANDLIDEIKNLDSFIIDIQNPARTLKVCTPFNEVIIKKEDRFKVIQVLLGMRRELADKLEKLGVTEE